MYPDWPQSAADLVPLPHCDGPKLKAFDFSGPQKIEFLGYLGGGGHSHVFKTMILGQVYALKLFRFVYDDDWFQPEDSTDPDDLEMMSAFYPYAEPFNAECRAFGRLQEAGHEELAVRCFGYLLLDEDHERAMNNQFSHLRLDFEGNGEWNGPKMRPRFLGRDNRLPPFRGIVKEFGQVDEDLRTRDVRRMFRTTMQLQQLGIINIDMAHRQLVNGKISDLSTAITFPHFRTNPELNPRLTPDLISALEHETFRLSVLDYWNLDEMAKLYNEEHGSGKKKIRFRTVPAEDEHNMGIVKYHLRSTPLEKRFCSFVDPRLYDWRTSAGSDGKGAADEQQSGRKKAKGSSRGKPAGGISKTRRHLDTNPPRWYYKPAHTDGKGLERDYLVVWIFKDGYKHPILEPKWYLRKVGTSSLQNPIPLSVSAPVFGGPPMVTSS